MSRPETQKRANLRDVARHAQVSVATVSRVLNKSQLVTKDTRDRVNRAIETLNFVPSAAARTLNSGNSRTIGALVPTLDHSIFARYLDALESRLSQHGYALIVAVTGGDPEEEERKAFGLLDLGVEGLLVSGRAHTAGFDTLIDRFRVPTLITSYYDPEARYPTIGYDNATIAANAFEFLRDLGHRSFAIVHGPLDVNDRFVARIDAIRDLAHDSEVTFRSVSMDVAGGANAVKELAAQSRLPTAILCLSDVQALGAMFELTRLGLVVPDDISVMGFDNLEWSAVSEPSMTSIKLPAAEMGAKASDAIVGWLQSGQRASPLALEADIVIRDSTRPLSKG
ncbi:LacI family DNA-binding transcriptional regulator [Aestuariibius sp. HNIBRBA575]|uniref:LacI family DNA-binding transcriptional regulator n=1 Tax=Aestuariibius sp. HNIBRBA575 TaxID=3233343 RepID=UPI0034A290F2